jgi:hypothetical protein
MLNPCHKRAAFSRKIQKNAGWTQWLSTIVLRLYRAYTTCTQRFYGDLLFNAEWALRERLKSAVEAQKKTDKSSPNANNRHWKRRGSSVASLWLPWRHCEVSVSSNISHFIFDLAALCLLKQRRANALKGQSSLTGPLWRLQGVLTTIRALLRSFHGVVIRSNDVLIGDCLRSDCALIAFFMCPLRFHAALAALNLRWNCKSP